MKDTEKKSNIDIELFKAPTKEYRGAPFWAWNFELEKDILTEEIEKMKEMGFGGFYMHTRLNMATKYMSDEFLDMIEACIKKGESTDMIPFLYDEDRYPSGDAGGALREESIENRQKYLTFKSRPYMSDDLNESDRENAVRFAGVKFELIACYDILFDCDGYIVEYKKIDIGQRALQGHEKWFAYMEYSDYTDVMRKATTEGFIKHTHEVYKKRIGDKFGHTVPAIFTDEPKMREKRVFNTSHEGVFVTSYTNDLPKTYEAEYGEDMLEYLPELAWERADRKPSTFRYRYLRHTADRFFEGFPQTVGTWCESNGLHLTGHVMGEETLHTQTLHIGEAMRHYKMFDLPGVDMLCDARELANVKQAVSVAHQFGKRGIMSEMYGVTNWDFDFRGHKLQGDWQAALGVVHRVPHLYWASMRGEAKRDYPASIGHQSPWYKEYKHIEDHFARVNSVMTLGTPEPQIAVIHPIETYWLNFGPADKTGKKREELDGKFASLTERLLRNLNDFDFVSEALLPEQYTRTQNGFSVGKMTYNTVILPFMETVRSSTLDALEHFADNGGSIIFLDGVPDLVDGAPSDRARRLAERCEVLSYSLSTLSEKLKKYNALEIKTLTGLCVDNIVCGVRRDGDSKYIFLSHIDKADCDAAMTEKYVLTLKGEWTVWEYDTLSGEKRKMGVSYVDGNTCLNWFTSAYSSCLLELISGKGDTDGFIYTEPSLTDDGLCVNAVGFELDEDNVLLLDSAEFSFNGGEYSKPMNVLKIDQILRKETGQSLATGRFRPQPYTLPKDINPKDTVSLRFKINSKIEYEGAKLGLEYTEYTTLSFNGESVPVTVDGYYIDKAVSTVGLPKIRKGENVLEVTLRYGNQSSVEAYYLLGGFGVESFGSENTVTELNSMLCFESVTEQGLPFYSGNIKYRMQFEGGGKKFLELSKYRGAVVKVFLDGREMGYIDFPPYLLSLGELDTGTHTLELILYGTRYNTLGQLHTVYDNIPWPGPDSWRTSGRFWTDAYNVRRMGLLTQPRILTQN